MEWAVLTCARSLGFTWALQQEQFAPPEDRNDHLQHRSFTARGQVFVHKLFADLHVAKDNLLPLPPVRTRANKSLLIYTSRKPRPQHQARPLDGTPLWLSQGNVSLRWLRGAMRKGLQLIQAILSHYRNCSYINPSRSEPRPSLWLLKAPYVYIQTSVLH